MINTLNINILFEMPVQICGSLNASLETGVQIIWMESLSHAILCSDMIYSSRIAQPFFVTRQ